MRDLLVRGASQAAERACRLAIAVVAANVVGRAAFGRFVFASTVTFLLALGTDLGTSVWTTRELARDRVQGPALVRLGLWLRAAATVPCGLAVAALASLAAEPETRTAIALLGVSSLGAAFADYFGAVLRGYERFVDDARLSGARALATTAAGLGALFASRTLAGLCAGLALANVACASLGWALAGPRRLGLPRTAAGYVDRDGAVRALRQSLPIWIAGLVSLLYFKVDTLFLKALTTDAELGAYGAAYKFFEGSMVLPSVLLSVAFPQLAQACGRPGEQRRLERRLALVLVGLGVATAAVCFGAAKPLVLLAFGPGFDRAVPSLRVLALGLPFLFLNFGLTHFLLARDRGKTTLWLAVMMLGLNVVLDRSLIPLRLGPGAALATAGSEGVLTLGCLAALGVGRGPAPLPRAARAGARRGQRAA
jgi:O-antigen/teichoic acid export membrane protein